MVETAARSYLSHAYHQHAVPLVVIACGASLVLASVAEFAPAWINAPRTVSGASRYKPTIAFALAELTLGSNQVRLELGGKQDLRDGPARQVEPSPATLGTTCSHKRVMAAPDAEPPSDYDPRWS